ncbi:MAG: ShlB/FhaC/HecB family hemolysin secretion/activation protein [Leptolyngbyaceae cyanobacterium bins.302]|nr:ShlB/FhaC/HecB family hemolysin secretion/activation protein [Leptolyngbyaceae cyanobacterium bins.302]
MNIGSKTSLERPTSPDSKVLRSRVLLLCFVSVAGITPAIDIPSVLAIDPVAPTSSLQAQATPIPQAPLPQDLQPPTPAPPLPPPQVPVPQVPPIEIQPVPLPPAGETLSPGSVPGTIVVKRFEVLGSTVFSAEELAAATAAFTNRPITFAELLQAQAAITKLYADQGYLTSGGVIPPQTVEGEVIVIQVVEGELEGINVTGTRRLNPNYVRSRIALGARKPLNTRRLLEALQLLQLNPLIQNISAELSSGTRTGTNFLDVRVNEAKTFAAQVELDNNRSPAVGSFRRGARISEANLLGQGDSLQVGYSNTDGSNVIDLSYTFPINPRNGTLSLDFQRSFYRIVEEPFEPLDLKANSRIFSLSYRQPVIETPTRLVALGLTAYRRDSETSILGIPFGLTPGSDDQGKTRVSAVRFFQEWVERGAESVFAARSELSVGTGAFNASLDAPPPNGRFVSWRGQLQWVRLLAPDTLLVLRSDLQLSDRALAPFDQFSLGGQNSVRGYRQDVLLADNGILASAEVRVPILRVPRAQGLLQVVPFVDAGRIWNSSGQANPSPNGLAAIGLGLRWQQGNLLTFRLDWGIPLVSIDSSRDTLQEKGLTFSLVYNLF